MVLGRITSYFSGMRIDPRYFNHFMVTVAVVCIIVIAITSIRYIGKQEDRFIGRLENQKLQDLIFKSTEGDTLSISRDQTTVLLFWATWSDRSLNVLKDLYYWHDQNPDFEIISSYVKDSDEFAAVYDRVDKARFTLVDGTPAYQDLRVPGVPTAIVFNPDGDVYEVEIGFRERPVWHTLSAEGYPQAEKQQ